MISILCLWNTWQIFQSGFSKSFLLVTLDCYWDRNHVLCKWLKAHTHTTHPFNGPLSGTTWVSWYQKGKTSLDFTEARDSEWQWHQLDHVQVCTLLHTDNHASTPPLSFFTVQMPFLPPNQQHQSTEGKWVNELKAVVSKSRLWLTQL